MATLKQPIQFRAWMIWGLGALFFLIEYFVRISPSVISNELMSAFSVKAFSIGGLSAFFYYAYAGMQIPAGLLVDRFGSYKLLVLATFCCAVGTLVFASSGSIMMAYLSRFIVGFGSAFAFVCALKLISIWFPDNKFSLLAGITQALGMVGAAIGDAPLSIIFHHFGWRKTMLGIALLFLLLCIAIIFIVKERKSSLTSRSETSLKPALSHVLSNPQAWLNGLFIGLLFAPTAAFAEQWGVPFLSNQNHLNPTVAAFDIGLIFIGLAIGCPVFGWLTEKLQTRTKIMRFSAIASLILLFIIIYISHYASLPNSILAILLFAYGLANSGIVPSYALAAKINPPQLTGLAIGFTNMASILIGAIFIPIIGFLLDYFWQGKIYHAIPLYSNTDYMISLSILPLSLLLAFMVSFMIKDHASA